MRLGDGMSAVATKQDFGTSRWQLADKLDVRAGNIVDTENSIRWIRDRGGESEHD